jgi:arsenite-transporting ATPase
VRILLVAGKGGVGKTTVAAATAATAAASGRKTLLMSTDPAHSLSDVLAIPVGAEPTEVDTGFSAQQVDARRGVERSWREIQSWLVALLDTGGVDPVAAEEITVMPGGEEVLALLEVRDQARRGLFDLIVVDCAPTAETLRLLALPEALRWWMDRLLPVERRVARSLRPVLSRVSSLPVPGERVYEAMGRLAEQLSDVAALLTDPVTTTVRLVLTPESVVIAEARRACTALSLHGYRVDGVVANRVFPQGPDGWRAGWVRAQRERLDEVTAAFAPLPVRRLAYQAGEPVGLAAFAALGSQIYGVDDPVAPPGPAPMSVERTVDGFALVLTLPFATRGEIDLVRRGDDLALTVGAHRRVITLPSALRRCTIEGATLREEQLRVRFVPDPAVWAPR